MDAYYCTKNNAKKKSGWLGWAVEIVVNNHERMSDDDSYGYTGSAVQFRINMCLRSCPHPPIFHLHTFFSFCCEQ
jgi:hypothetical protein